jgi:putative spermidine/putrescine transport system ATP-binding protein
MPAHITFDQITKRYGAYTALHPISLDIPAGQLVAIVGPSGCGKSTLLRLLAGFITPHSGRILVDGQPIDHLPPEHRPTSLVFQNYALWPHKTVAEHIAFGLRVRGWTKAAIAARITEMLALVGLSGLEQRYPGQLSGGQQQRVALARSLAIAPGILLLDEPLSNLDAQIRVQMRSELRALQQRVGLTTLYVTHDQEEALSVADRVMVLRSGVVEHYAAPEEIYQRPASPFVAQFIGQSNLLPGCIEAVDRYMLQIRLHNEENPDTRTTVSDLLTLPRVNWLAGHEPLPGQRVVVAIKPEHLRLVKTPPPPAGDTRLPGQLVNRSFLGAAQQFIVQTAYGSVTARMSSAEVHGFCDPAYSGAVWVMMAPQQVLVYPDRRPAQNGG